jgi:hypothetical protein
MPEGLYMGAAHLVLRPMRRLAVPAGRPAASFHIDWRILYDTDSTDYADGEVGG